MLRQAWPLLWLAASVALVSGGPCSFYCFHLPVSTDDTNIKVLNDLACTDVVYGLGSFGTETPNIINVLGNDVDVGGVFDSLAMMKKNRPAGIVRTLFAINSDDNLTFLKSKERRAEYINALLEFSKHYKFDGFMFDFLPKVYNNDNFALFLQEIAAEKMKRSVRLKITLSVGARFIVRTGPKWASLATYIDEVYMVASDVVSFEKGHVALLGDALHFNDHIPREDTIAHNTRLLAQFGIPKKKIIVGLTIWGRVYRLRNTKTVGHLAPVFGYAPTDTGLGTLRYNEICKLKIPENVRIDPKASTMSFRGEQNLWYSFTEHGSILQQKLDFVGKQGLGGIGAATISGDDVDGECGFGRMPIHKFIGQHMVCNSGDVHEPRKVTIDCPRVCVLRPEHAATPFEFEGMEPSWCSHIVLSSADIFGSGYLQMKPNMMAAIDAYDNWNVLSKPPMLLGIGENQDEGVWNLALLTPLHREILINSISQMLRDYKLDGVEISFVKGSVRPTEKDTFAEFIAELHRKLVNIHIIVTITPQSLHQNNYMMEILDYHADYVILQGHRFRDPQSMKTGHNSAMFSTSGHESSSQPMSLDAFAKEAIKQKLSTKKLLLGISAEGTITRVLGGFRNEGNGEDEMALPQFNRAVSQTEICEILKKKSAKARFNEAIGVPSIVDGEDYITYDDARSVKLKTHEASLNYGGVALYALERENTKGECEPKKKFSLLRSIADAQVCDLCLGGHSPFKQAKQCEHGFRTTCTYRLPRHGETDPLTPALIPYHRCSEIVVEEFILDGDGDISFADAQTMNYFWSLDEHQKNNKKHRRVNMIATIRCGMLKTQVDKVLGMTSAVRQIMDFITFHGFSGLQLKCNHVITPKLKNKFAKFVTTLKNEIAKDTSTPDGCPKALSIRIPAWEHDLTVRYDVNQLNELDAVVLDLFREDIGGSTVVSPIFNMADGTRKFTVESTLQHWVNRGLRKSSVILNIPTYGVSVTKTSADPDKKVENRKKICQLLHGTQMPRMVQDALVARLDISNETYITFETTDTISYKVRYAQREGFGGIGLVSLNEDDFTSACLDGHYPLHNMVHRVVMCLL